MPRLHKRDADLVEYKERFEELDRLSAETDEEIRRAKREAAEIIERAETAQRRLLIASG